MSAPKVKRYRPVVWEVDDRTSAGMQEVACGKFVLYTDYEQVIRERDEARAELRQAGELYEQLQSTCDALTGEAERLRAERDEARVEAEHLRHRLESAIRARNIFTGESGLAEKIEIVMNQRDAALRANKDCVAHFEAMKAELEELKAREVKP